MYWPKLARREIKKRVLDALKGNISYRHTPVLGLPGTYLDEKIFYEHAPFLRNTPFLLSLLANPNHIGCHTLDKAGEPFSGTQELEKEVIRICAEQILGGKPHGHDGYIASGGTEANIEALWIYRNYFRNTCNAGTSQVGVIFSEDTHYSIVKAANLLSLYPVKVKVAAGNRSISLRDLAGRVREAQEQGIHYFIVVMNLSTTMFGSVDDIEAVVAELDKMKVNFQLHVDAAFGGFVFPFTKGGKAFSFQNPRITSFTIDGHKMLQTPYGTGIFLVRKGYMDQVCTTDASYVKGMDHTLCGSRSGANAVAVWMVLHAHGSAGWKEKMLALVKRTSALSALLKAKKIRHYHHPGLNIIAIDAKYISRKTAEKYLLIPDRHEAPRWWKIVMMPHIRPRTVAEFVRELQLNQA